MVFCSILWTETSGILGPTPRAVWKTLWEDAEGIIHLDQVLAQVGFRLFCSINLVLLLRTLKKIHRNYLGNIKTKKAYLSDLKVLVQIHIQRSEFRCLKESAYKVGDWIPPVFIQDLFNMFRWVWFSRWDVSFTLSELSSVTNSSIYLPRHMHLRCPE